VLAKLGEGGWGEVYRARDPRLARDVALKILRDRTDRQASRIERFVSEARAASALNHPNIIAVFDAEVDGATPYLVTELIDGESLATEIRRGPIPLRRVLDLATQIADGLAEAHASGIVHGDLKVRGRRSPAEHRRAVAEPCLAAGRVSAAADRAESSPHGGGASLAAARR
jgi:serine/threonine protein kinase